MRVLRIIELVVRVVSHMLVRVTWQGRREGNNEEFQPLK